MQKKKQKLSNSAIAATLKKYWWLVLVLILTFGWLGYMALSRHALQQRFESTYTQVSGVFSILESSTQSEDKDRSVLRKLCKQNYEGFNSYIECGSYATVYVTSEYLDDVKKDMQNRLNGAGFTNIHLIPISSNSDKEGSGVFYTKSSMRCGLYWGTESKTSSKPILDFYCREIVPDFLPGYERE